MASFISSGLVRGGGNTKRWKTSIAETAENHPLGRETFMGMEFVVPQNSADIRPTNPSSDETLLVPDPRALGFTGNTCTHCLGTHMLQTGHCETCQDCGQTSACA